MDKLTICLSTSGLGDHLFQIFAVISKAIDEKRDFCIINQNSGSFRPHYFDSLFKSINDKVIHDNSFNPWNDTSFYLHKDNEFFNPIPDNQLKILGYFQNPKYFKHNEDKIIEILKLREQQDLYKFNDKIIGVHLRFNDILYEHGHVRPEFLHCLHKPEYYINALKLMREKLKDFNEYKIVIFCGLSFRDYNLVNKYINYFKKHSDIKNEFIKFYEIKPDTTNVDDFLYLSNCNHYILSPSGFSWWAVYLNRNKDKIVISPKRHWKNEFKGSYIKTDYMIDDYIYIDEHFYSNIEEFNQIYINY
jgi:hypothetical protein